MSETARALGLPGEIEWQGRTLKVSRLYFKIEGLFETWLERNLYGRLSQLRGVMGEEGYRDALREANGQVAARAFAWDSTLAVEAAWGKEGFRELSYLCLHDQDPKWTRAEHDRLLADPVKREELACLVHRITAPLKNGCAPGQEAPGACS